MATTKLKKYKHVLCCGLVEMNALSNGNTESKEELKCDKGVLVLTHIYLLAGCGIPIWFCTTSNIATFSSSTQGTEKMAIAAGILSTGIGDAMGAVIGATIGKHRLLGTTKSWEGSQEIQ